MESGINAHREFEVTQGRQQIRSRILCDLQRHLPELLFIPVSGSRRVKWLLLHPIDGENRAGRCRHPGDCFEAVRTLAFGRSK